MNLDELKRIRKENILAHKKKKKEYYLKKKIIKKEIDYESELSGENFFTKIREITHNQKVYLDDRKELIISKLNEYKNTNKEYREKKKEELKAYRKEYYKKLKDKQNKL